MSENWIQQMMFYIKDQINIKIKNKQTANNNIKTKQLFYVILLCTIGTNILER